MYGILSAADRLISGVGPLDKRVGVERFVCGGITAGILVIEGEQDAIVPHHKRTRIHYLDTADLIIGDLQNIDAMRCAFIIPSRQNAPR
jgi:hypothetical protein